MKRPPQGASPALRLFLIALAALSGLALSSAAGGDRWFSLSLGGQKIGYLREASALESSGAAASKETRVEMMLTLNRLGNKVEMATITTTREDSSGRLLSVKSEMRSSAQVIRSEGTVGGREIRLTTWSGDTPYTRVLPFEGELLGPQGIGDLTRSRLTEGGDTMSYLTFSPELSQVVKGERKALGHEPIEGSGGRAAALKIQETLAGTPLTRTIWIDGAGEPRSGPRSPLPSEIFWLSSQKRRRRFGMRTRAAYPRSDTSRPWPNPTFGSPGPGISIRSLSGSGISSPSSVGRNSRDPTRPWSPRQRTSSPCASTVPHSPGRGRRKPPGPKISRPTPISIRATR